jgi:hydrogenase nickel incorporation protein HypB
MCDTCGCSNPDEVRIHEPGAEHSSAHNHTHDHDHHHGQKSGSLLFNPPPAAKGKVISLNLDILSDNNRLAVGNRKHFSKNRILCLNLVSSPGSGKTSILERTIRELSNRYQIAVIEGDQQTLLDANRIEQSGARAIQINTGSGCHLDAKMVGTAMQKLNPEPDSILFVENVGNLVCPAMFDLGENKRVVVISVTEGEDKPLKYPYMFQSSHLCLINKSDLLPYVDFDTAKAIAYARSLNPQLEFLILSVKTGDGMDEWYQWLERQKAALAGPSGN